MTMVKQQDGALVSLQATPAMIVAAATEQADVLMAVVEKQKLFTMIGGKKHLHAEAWETIAAFNRCGLVPEWIRPVVDKDGDEIGMEAKINIVSDDTSAIVGGGIMSCGYDEFPCRGKEGMAKRKAAMSAAQTWAAAKACRIKWARIAVMAGYSGTPAAEMTTEAPQDDDSGHWCQAHGTAWFKRGRMRGYAHPIGDSKEWCDQPVDDSYRPLRSEERAKPASLAQEYAALAKQLGWDGPRTKAFVQDEFGNEWVKITEGERVAAVDNLKAMVEKIIENPPQEERDDDDVWKNFAATA